MLELTPLQTAVLERLRQRGFQFVAYPLYASHLGVRKGECAALLAPVPGGGLALAGEACYLVEGNFSVRVARPGGPVFVWKNREVPVTPQREQELARFRAELDELLRAPS